MKSSLTDIYNNHPILVLRNVRTNLWVENELEVALLYNCNPHGYILRTDLTDREIKGPSGPR